MRLHDVEKEVKHFSGVQKVLITIICVLLILGIITVANGSNTISKTGYDAFTMLRYSIIEHPVEVITGWMDDLAHLREVQEENEELHAIIASQDMYKAELEEKERMLAEMEALMEFDSNAHYKKEYATIIYRDMNAWSNMITLNKGEKDGIKTDMAVISYEGLIGKVVEVNKNTSKVKLLTNENKDISVAINIVLEDETTTAGILENYDAENGRYNVQVFDTNVEIEKGMKILTSGTGGVFPSGILVGEVEDVTLLYNSKGRIVSAIPSVHFNDFDYVAVLKVD